MTSESSNSAARSNAFNHATTSWLGDDDDDDDDVRGGGAARMVSLDSDDACDHSSADEDEAAVPSHLLMPSLEEQISLLDQHDQLVEEDGGAPTHDSRSHQIVDAAERNGIPVASPAAGAEHVASTPPAPHVLAMSDSDASSTVRLTYVGVEGVLPRRDLYYRSQACLARAFDWWEEQEQCVIT